ncbi:GNAT family N-acetyltransferase [Phreatobacter sp.]|uniref:GNAT family N-acetyltransferase n=1 Tax=Phreatobacter sp. TaxID=1966341 RepID=UPI003F6F2049
MIRIDVLDAADAARYVPGLAAVLTDCVQNGASVSFMKPYGQADAEAFFHRVAGQVAAGGAVLVAAFSGDRILGTAQLGLDMPQNQPHRAEVRKMLVHSAGRQQGIAASMLGRLEAEALARGRTLLVLDTSSDVARRVYERGGWSRCGHIPDFALWPDGGLCDTTFYMKDLTPHAILRAADVIVRDAREDDLPAILAITNEAIETTTALWSDEPVTLENRRDWWLDRLASGNPVLVAEEAGGVAGFGSYLQFRAWDGYRNAVEHSVYVRADRRRSGVGSALVEALIARARTAGKQVIIGGIEGQNHASLKLHRRAGFIEVGRMPGIGEKFGRKLDLVFVQKQIA